MSRSTDTLTKSTATDYKKMVSNGSIDSMDKSALSSETSYDIYDTQNGKKVGAQSHHHQEQSPEPLSPTSTLGYSDILNAKYNEYATQNQMKSSPPSRKAPDTKVYGLPEYNAQGFELAYRNEGFRDNSTYGGGTRTNSVSNYLNEDTPIIHQIDPDDGGSDYYGNSSTLPMRAKGENLSFLTELKHKLPEYEKLPSKPGHSSFLPAPPDPPTNHRGYSSPSVGYQKQINNPSPTKNEYQQPEFRRPGGYSVTPTPPPPIPTDIRRPDSYFAAMRSVRESRPPSPPPPLASPTAHHRPKTVYEASGDDRRNTKYSRSKSEALLETNFDEEPSNPLTSDSRSYSQPLETAM